MQSSLDRFIRKRQAPAESNCGEEEKCQEKEPKTTEALRRKEETRGPIISTGVEENICVASVRRDQTGNVLYRLPGISFSSR